MFLNFFLVTRKSVDAGEFCSILRRDKGSRKNLLSKELLCVECSGPAVALQALYNSHPVQGAAGRGNDGDGESHEDWMGFIIS